MGYSENMFIHSSRSIPEVVLAGWLIEERELYSRSLPATDDVGV